MIIITLNMDLLETAMSDDHDHTEWDLLETATSDDHDHTEYGFTRNGHV
jgi:hypothetical protein